VLKGLQAPVKVQAFYAGSEPEFPELESRLRQYKAQTDKKSPSSSWTPSSTPVA